MANANNGKKKYLVLYMAPIESFEEVMRMPTDAAGPIMDAWNKWLMNSADFLVDGGAPLGKAKKILPDGTTADSRNTIGGYAIVEAKSLDDAAKLFGKEHPHFMIKDAWIEVTELVDMPATT